MNVDGNIVGYFISEELYGAVSYLIRNKTKWVFIVERKICNILFSRFSGNKGVVLD